MPTPSAMFVESACRLTQAVALTALTGVPAELAGVEAGSLIMELLKRANACAGRHVTSLDLAVVNALALVRRSKYDFL